MRRASSQPIALRNCLPNTQPVLPAADSKSLSRGAGGAAHLPGMAAAYTVLPVLGVPIESKSLKGIDSLLSIVQMPAGIPVGTLAIGKAGSDQTPRYWPSASSEIRAPNCARNFSPSVKSRPRKC